MKSLKMKKFSSISGRILFSIALAAGSGALIHFGGQFNVTPFENSVAYTQKNLDERKAKLKNQLPLIERTKEECKAKAVTPKGSEECERTAYWAENTLESQIKDANHEFNAANVRLSNTEQEHSKNTFTTAFVVLFASLFSFFFPGFKSLKQAAETKPTEIKSTKQEEWSDYQI